MFFRRPLQNPVGVGLALLLVAFGGRWAVDRLERIHLPSNSLVTAAVEQRQPTQEAGFPLTRGSGEILLEYTNGLAGCFIEEDLLPPVNWQTAVLLCAAADACSVTVETISFPAGQFTLSGRAETQEDLTAFMEELDGSDLLPDLEWDTALLDDPLSFVVRAAGPTT